MSVTDHHTADHHEAVARRALAPLVGLAPDDVDLDADLGRDLGLTSINKVLLLTDVCDEVGVDLGSFTEQDLAGMTTLRGVVDAMGRTAEAPA